MKAFEKLFGITESQVKETCLLMPLVWYIQVHVRKPVQVLQKCLYLSLYGGQGYASGSKKISSIRIISLFFSLRSIYDLQYLF